MPKIYRRRYFSNMCSHTGFDQTRHLGWHVSRQEISKLPLRSNMFIKCVWGRYWKGQHTWRGLHRTRFRVWIAQQRSEDGPVCLWSMSEWILWCGWPRTDGGGWDSRNGNWVNGWERGSCNHTLCGIPDGTSLREMQSGLLLDSLLHSTQLTAKWLRCSLKLP